MTSTMALSLLQDAQTRGIAAALAGMKREEHERGLTISPPNITTSQQSHIQQSPLYPNFGSATPFNMLSPTQLMAANRRAAAAALMGQLQIPNLASISSLFPHHPALFPGWPAAAPHSPPASPISPILNHKKSSINNNGHNNNNNNNLLLPIEQHAPSSKKNRKISVKKDLMSPPIDIPSTTSDIFGHQNGPISPPSSGSSPNSQQDGPISVHHKDPTKDKSFTCKICNRSFGYKHVLQNHERTHTGEKPFECPECHKRFTRDHHLKTHMRLHTGEKPYHCNHCDRQFVQVANLRRHLRVHTGERPYKCDICEAHFSDSNQLKSHHLVHRGEKPFECERCHMKFRRRHHFMHHKCGTSGSLLSPPTPAISPAISEYGIEQKSTISSFNESDEIMENLKHNDMMPLDLSEDASVDVYEKRSRKSTDIRRLIRLQQPIVQHIPANIPEQTEPEDLSVHRTHSPSFLHQDDDLEDLDDAATLALKQRQKILQAVHHIQSQTPIKHIKLENSF